ncbi:GNAT family N-acetyltransferase [Ktedonosporobacter rubrisoli]|nr:GNAT family N-acetyltransferase [Ktedonosporobacter rubrisoli]
MSVSHEEELQRALVGLKIAPGIAIRAWQEGDFSAIQRLSEAEGWPTPVARPEEALAGWSNSWPTLVATADEEVVGFVRAWSDGHITTYIMELLIDAQWRQRGVGSSLLDVCHALYPRARMEVTSTEGSASFYRRYGFRDIGHTHRKSFVR